MSPSEGHKHIFNYVKYCGSVMKVKRLRENLPPTLNVDKQVIIKSTNANRIDWQLTKLVENLSWLIHDTILYSKEQKSSKELAKVVGKTYVSLNIIAEILGCTLVQNQIDIEQRSIDNKVKTITRRENSPIGFQVK